MATGIVLTLEVWELKIKNPLSRTWLIVVMFDISDIRSKRVKEIKMVRNKHHEDSTNGQEGDNDLEAMISSFGLREVFLRTVLLQEHCLKWNSSCCLLYGMEILLVQPNVSLI